MTNTVLSPRERQVALLVPSGQTRKQIGDELGISWRTVSFHLTMIYKRVGVKNRVQLTTEILNGRLALNSPTGRGV